MATSLTSVVIPSYNRAKYLPLTVESALNQEGAEVEVVVIDDGSTDDTADVVQKHRPKWGERFHYFWQQNSERSIARNNGLEHARGEFVAFLDSDDLWRPNHLRTSVTALTESPDTAAAYAEHGLIDAEGRVISAHVNRGKFFGDSFGREICLKQFILFPSEVVVRRSVLDRAYGNTDVFDPLIMVGEDWLVWVKLLQQAPFHRVGEPTVWRRLHPNTTWGDPGRFTKHSVRACNRILETGLPEKLGITAARLTAINETHCAYAYYLAGDWSTARTHLLSALRTYPRVLRESHFWSVSLRLLLGKRLTQTIRSARHQGHGEPIGPRVSNGL